MTITIDPQLELKLRALAEAEGVAVETYIEGLIRWEDAEIAHTEAMLEEAVASGGYIELDSEEWDLIEREAIAEVEAKSKRSL